MLLIATVTIRPVASAVCVGEYPKLEAANLGFHNKVVWPNMCDLATFLNAWYSVRFRPECSRMYTIPRIDH
jgi:hypothetical protein